MKIKKIKKSKIDKVDFDNLGFGNIVSDHMLMCHYKNGNWQRASIRSFGKFHVAPTTLVFHYGQSVFEGLRACRTIHGNISVFRVQKHHQRLCSSLERMCMPMVPFELFDKGIRQLLKLDASWVPEKENSSLYIRPFVFASEQRFGVKIADEYCFIIFTGPINTYYNAPLKVKIETVMPRATKGGTGAAKYAGNYAAAFYPAKIAKQEGFDQILWTDCSDKINIEESSIMNVFFLINNVLVTPELSDTILEGITRDSFIQIAKNWNIPVEERKISAHELVDANKKGRLQEAFGVGTAAVCAPIKHIHLLGKDIILPDYDANSFMTRAKHFLNDMRLGKIADIFNWNTLIEV